MVIKKRYAKIPVLVKKLALLMLLGCSYNQEFEPCFKNWQQ